MSECLGGRGTKDLASPSFFFNDTATTEIYPLSLHDALPISLTFVQLLGRLFRPAGRRLLELRLRVIRKELDRKSTRLNSSHLVISYAVFCLKKKTTASAFRDEVCASRHTRCEPLLRFSHRHV